MALSPNQKAYSKEVHRIQTHIDRLKREGLTISNVIPETPKRITQKDIDYLSSITPAVLRAKAEEETRINKTPKQDTISPPKQPKTDTSSIGTRTGRATGNRSGNPSNLQHRGNPKNLTHRGNPQGNPNAKPPANRGSRGADKQKRKTRSDKGIPRNNSTAQQTLTPDTADVYPVSWQVAQFNSTMNVIQKFALPIPQEVLTNFMVNMMNEVGIDALAEALYEAQENGHVFYEAMLYDSSGEMAARYSLDVLNYLNIPTEQKNIWRMYVSQNFGEDIDIDPDAKKYKILSYDKYGTSISGMEIFECI